MSSPRHLWSGEWRLDSAAAAEELAKRRAQKPEQERVEPQPDPRPPDTRQSAAALRRLASGVQAWWIALREAVVKRAAPIRRSLSGRGNRIATVVLVAVMTLVTAGVAFAVTSYLVNSGGSSQSVANNRAWLGIGMSNSPSGGVRVVTVAPNSPGSAAGLQQGDLITEINSQPIQSVGDVNAALNGLVPGNTIQVQFNRGPANYSTLVRLAARPRQNP